jgi:hypothetical protein
LTEKEFCCIECVHKDATHTAHKIVSLTSILGKLKEELREFRNDAITMGKACKDILLTTERSEKNLIKSLDEYKSRISREFATLYRALERSESKLMNDVEYVMGERIREVRMRKENSAFLEKK